MTILFYIQPLFISSSVLIKTSMNIRFLLYPISTLIRKSSVVNILMCMHYKLNSFYHMRINKTANDKKKIHLRIEEKEKKDFLSCILFSTNRCE